MRPRTAVLLALLAVATASSGPRAADPEPQVIKASLVISPFRFTRYFPAPNAQPNNAIWSWRPRLWFRVQGPLGGGSQISVAFSKPDGTPWLTMPCETPEIAVGETEELTGPKDRDDFEKLATTAPGVYPFKINLKNPLAGTTTTLYSGKFKVGKIHDHSYPAADTGKFDYYIDHDWTLPIGYWFEDRNADEKTPRLTAVMWFRGKCSISELAGYVFYKGKQVASTKLRGQGNVDHNYPVESPGSDPEARWERFSFVFQSVCVGIEAGREYPESYHLLPKYPGDYEIKVLRGGNLVRIAAFAVGPDGKIVDNGLRAANKMGGSWNVLPVKVLPGTDGKPNPEAYKTDAYYGNPLAGFNP